MQSFLETTALPVLGDAPAWTIRVARPITPDRDELAHELRGVPKAALRQVFGKLLGTRLWQPHRSTESATSKAATVAQTFTTPTVPDAEIRGGMLRYLCAEASTTLRERQRLAKSISLTVLYADAGSETVRESLPQAANDAFALETAARLAMGSLRSGRFVALKLDVVAICAPLAPRVEAEPAESRPSISRAA